MKELLDYDNGSVNYLEQTSSNSFPLLSWDFHMQNLLKISNNLSDVQTINGIKKAFNWNYNVDFEKAFDNDTVVLITNSKLEIIFSSQNIIKMNGYKSEETIGNSPKMFQGKATCKKISAEIKESIMSKVPFEKWVLNYKKNGEIYNCHIKGFPIFDNKGVLCNFIAFEKAA
jgi:hypothetical protein